jgi:hypothetical protein
MSGLSWEELLYVIALLSGGVLVIASALGAGELGAEDAAALADSDVELDPAAGSASADGVLELLGVGRVPTSVLALLLSLIFGGSGLLLSPPCRALLGAGAGPKVALAVAALTALAGTVALGRVFVRVLPLTESYASSKHDLVGRAGRVVVCDRAGDAVIAVVDAGGAELRVRARLSGAVLAGSQVVIDGYDRARDVYAATEIA